VVKGGGPVLLKNYMEDLVDSVIKEIVLARDDVCKCERCLLDIKAFALNQLPPRYVVTDKGYAFSKTDELGAQFVTDVTVAVTQALHKVMQRPPHC
jgi:competence protein ComFB